MAGNEGLGAALKNLYRGIVSLITTGSWKVEEAADKARSAETLLDHVDEAVEQDAQKTLDHVDDALTSWNLLNAKAARLKQAAEQWRAKAEKAATEAAKYADGTADKAKYADLTKSALKEALRAEDQLKPMTQAIEEARPDVEAALEAVEKVGLSKEQALSERDRLDVARATAEAKQNLAMATRAGFGSESKRLLAEATEKIDRMQAQAEADEAITAHLPKDAGAVDAEISLLSRDDRVNEAYEALMAKVAPAKTAA